MERAPKIGQRIRVKPDHRYFPTAGVVTKVYPKRAYLVADDDPRWDDEDFVPPRGGLLPERDWQITMAIDAIPENWAYGPNCKVFCPSVSEIEAA